MQATAKRLIGVALVAALASGCSGSPSLEPTPPNTPGGATPVAAASLEASSTPTGGPGATISSDGSAPSTGPSGSGAAGGGGSGGSGAGGPISVPGVLMTNSAEYGGPVPWALWNGQHFVVGQGSDEGQPQHLVTFDRNGRLVGKVPADAVGSACPVQLGETPGGPVAITVNATGSGRTTITVRAVSLANGSVLWSTPVVSESASATLDCGRLQADYWAPWALVSVGDKGNEGAYPQFLVNLANGASRQVNAADPEQQRILVDGMVALWREGADEAAYELVDAATLSPIGAATGPDFSLWPRATRGPMEWMRQPDVEYYGPAVSGRHLLIPDGATLTLHDLVRGGTRWSATLPGAAQTVIWDVASKRMYAAVPGAGLVAIDESTGRTAWTGEPVTKLCGVVGDQVLALAGGRLVRLAVATGASVGGGAAASACPVMPWGDGYAVSVTGSGASATLTISRP